jgi:hypothetical protein
MNSRIVFGALAFAAAVTIVSAIWFLARRPESGGGGAPLATSGDRGDGAESAPTQPGTLESGGDDESNVTPGQQIPERASVTPPPTLLGRAVDEMGAPVPGANVWCVPTVGTGPRRVWCDQPWTEIESELAAARTDSNGHFELGLVRAPRSGVEYAVWVTKLGYECACALIPDAAFAGPLQLVLRPAVPVTISVVDAAGMPVECVVEQFGLAFSAFDRARAGDAAPGIEVFHRRFDVGVEGRVEVPFLPGRSIVIATRGAERSCARYVEAPGTSLSLELAPTFTWEGRVLANPDMEDEHAPRVLVGAIEHEQFSWIGMASVRPDGSIGPDTLALIPETTYTFSLQGGRYLSEENTRASPRAGEHVRIEFEGKRGVDVLVETVDPRARPIARTLVRAGWRRSEDGLEMSSSWSQTDEEGWATLTGCPRDGVWIDASAEGFVSATRMPVAFRTFDPAAVTIELVPSGRIEGRVTRAGEPVPGFDLFGWTSDVLRPSSWHFESQDGTFTLKDVPAVDTHLVATSTECPRSTPALAEFDDHGVAAVELVLEDAVLGTGSVIDADSRSPIEAAQVQSYTNHGISPIAPWGAPASTDLAGRFELSAFPLGQGAIWVTAEGYQGSMGFARADHGDPLDFGVIPLFRETSITVQLVSAEPRDFTRYLLAAHDGVVQDPMRFPESGRLSLGRATSTRYLFEIFHPGGYSDVFEHHQRPGDPWLVTYEIAGGISLEIVPVAEPGCGFDGAWPVEVVHRRADGRVARLVEWSEDAGPCVVAGLEPGPVVVHAGDARNGPSGAVQLVLDLRPQQAVEVELDCLRRALRLEDHRGDAVAGTSLELWDEDESPRRMWWTTTDGAGGFDVAASAAAARLRSRRAHNARDPGGAGASSARGAGGQAAAARVGEGESAGWRVSPGGDLLLDHRDRERPDPEPPLHRLRGRRHLGAGRAGLVRGRDRRAGSVVDVGYRPLRAGGRRSDVHPGAAARRARDHRDVRRRTTRRRGRGAHFRGVPGGRLGLDRVRARAARRRRARHG